VRRALSAGLLAATLLSGMGAVYAESIPTRGVQDSRIRFARYDADEVYRLNGVVGYAIELVFEEGERYLGQGGGDLEGVGIDAHDRYVLLKPRAVVVATNLVIYTDRRAYRFDYSVVEHATRDELVYALKFQYVPAAPGGPTPEQQIEQRLAAAETVRARNVDYWYCGHPALRPAAASDDGVHTRLTFGDRAEVPAVFVLNEDGSESLLNFSMDGGDLVIHRVAPRLALRRGKLAGCIVNKGYVGSGSRLESGTVSPEVERGSRVNAP
jgi:type IV secretion system protein VirB9